MYVMARWRPDSLLSACLTVLLASSVVADAVNSVPSRKHIQDNMGVIENIRTSLKEAIKTGKIREMATSLLTSTHNMADVINGMAGNRLNFDPFQPRSWTRFLGVCNDTEWAEFERNRDSFAVLFQRNHSASRANTITVTQTIGLLCFPC